MMSYSYCILFLGTLANTQLIPPPYFQSQIDAHDALQIIDQQILSMDGNVPLLNDSRRHYAEFVHVIYSLGEAQISCVPIDYDNDYQVNINEYAPQAIHDTQTVVGAVKKQIAEYEKATNLIRIVIGVECMPLGLGSHYHLNSSPILCDARIQKIVDSPWFPKHQATILLAAGKVAKSFLLKHKEFLEASQDHSSLKYIINGANELRDIVTNVVDYLKESHNYHSGPVKC